MNGVKLWNDASLQDGGQGKHLSPCFFFKVRHRERPKPNAQELLFDERSFTENFQCAFFLNNKRIASCCNWLFRFRPRSAQDSRFWSLGGFRTITPGESVSTTGPIESAPARKPAVSSSVRPRWGQRLVTIVSRSAAKNEVRCHGALPRWVPLVGVHNFPSGR